jgi:sulfite reductase beta subunit-like hemoprotein
VVTCPGAYTCNLGLTKTMNLGAALQDTVRQYDDPQVKRLSIKVSGCPNACGHHWTADLGFYGNARKIDGKRVLISVTRQNRSRRIRRGELRGIWERFGICF